MWLKNTFQSSEPDYFTSYGGTIDVLPALVLGLLLIVKTDPSSSPIVTCAMFRVYDPTKYSCETSM